MIELQKDILRFSSNWETYLEKCQKTNGGNKTDDEIYKLFFYEIENKFKSLVDERVYKVKSSLGSGRVTAVPWIGIMHKEITESAQKGIYLVYLFSRNAKKCFSAMEIGAGQFNRIFGENSKSTERLKAAKNKFQNHFSHYSPFKSECEINLVNAEDEKFIEKFGELNNKPKFKIDNYIAGSFFAKEYSLDNSFLKEDIQNDLKKYLNTYESIINDPLGISHIEYLLDSVYEKTDLPKKVDLDYEIPEFVPNPNLQKSDDAFDKKNSKSKNNKKYSFAVPSKKVGRAGEEYVFKFEYNKLVKAGRQDLAQKIVKQYEILNDFPGYDIKSFNKNGDEIYIEVKSTKSEVKSYFEISRNEVEASEKLKDQYFIYHVVDVLKNPKIMKSIQNPSKKIEKGEILIDPFMYQLRF